MDFVPARSKKAIPGRKKVTTVRKEVGVAHRETRTNRVISEKVDFDDKATKLGVVEDLSPKLVGTKKVVKARTTGAKAKVAKPVAKPVEKVEEYKTPKSPFINQDKVAKRPLSKNVYRKEVATPEEIPQGPVTIITKPEKDAHVSMVVTIILTIILGAAAGTVAFLLLPK